MNQMCGCLGVGLCRVVMRLIVLSPSGHIQVITISSAPAAASSNFKFNLSVITESLGRVTRYTFRGRYVDIDSTIVVCTGKRLAYCLNCVGKVESIPTKS